MNFGITNFNLKQMNITPKKPKLPESRGAWIKAILTGLVLLGASIFGVLEFDLTNFIPFV